MASQRRASSPAAARTLASTLAAGIGLTRSALRRRESIWRARWRKGFGRARRGERFEHAPVGQRKAVGMQRLDADVVGAGLVVRADARADRVLVAPRDDCVHEPVTAAR